MTSTGLSHRDAGGKKGKASCALSACRSTASCTGGALFVCALFLLATLTIPVSGRDWEPEDITNMVAWFDASDADTLWADTNATITATANVARWDDKSVNGNHATQGTGGNQPTTGIRTNNGLNMIFFNGNVSGDQSLRLNQLPDGCDYVMIYEAESPDNHISLMGDSDTALPWGHGGRGNEPFRVNGTTPAGSSVLFGGESSQSVSSQDTAYTAYTTNRLFAATNIDGFSTRIGNGHGGNGWTHEHFGSIAEIMIFPTDMEIRQQAEGYLAWKWGVVDDLPAEHPYKDAHPITPDKGTVIKLY